MLRMTLCVLVILVAVSTALVVPGQTAAEKKCCGFCRDISQGAFCFQNQGQADCGAGLTCCYQPWMGPCP